MVTIFHHLPLLRSDPLILLLLFQLRRNEVNIFSFWRRRHDHFLNEIAIDIQWWLIANLWCCEWYLRCRFICCSHGRFPTRLLFLSLQLVPQTNLIFKSCNCLTFLKCFFYFFFMKVILLLFLFLFLQNLALSHFCPS